MKYVVLELRDGGFADLKSAAVALFLESGITDFTVRYSDHYIGGIYYMKMQSDFRMTLYVEEDNEKSLIAFSRMDNDYSVILSGFVKAAKK